MNTTDIILIIILFVAVVRGFIKGFFVEFASVAAIVLGVLFAMMFSVYLRNWLTGVVSWQPGTIKAASFFLIFITVLIIVHLIANALEKLVRAVALGLISRIGGAIFGVIKTAFILSFLMYIIARIETYDVTIIPKQQKGSSIFYVPIEKLAPNILPFLRDEKDEIQKKVVT